MNALQANLDALFQLTRLMRGVTLRGNGKRNGHTLFQLTRLMRGVTTVNHAHGKKRGISTHTPHARRDVFQGEALRCLRISTHTPHARRDKNELCNSQR